MVCYTTLKYSFGKEKIGVFNGVQNCFILNRHLEKIKRVSVSFIKKFWIEMWKFYKHTRVMCFVNKYFLGRHFSTLVFIILRHWEYFLYNLKNCPNIDLIDDLRKKQFFFWGGSKPFLEVINLSYVVFCGRFLDFLYEFENWIECVFNFLRTKYIITQKYTGYKTRI